MKVIVKIFKAIWSFLKKAWWIFVLIAVLLLKAIFGRHKDEIDYKLEEKKKEYKSLEDKLKELKKQEEEIKKIDPSDKDAVKKLEDIIKKGK